MLKRSLALSGCRRERCLPTTTLLAILVGLMLSLSHVQSKSVQVRFGYMAFTPFADNTDNHVILNSVSTEASITRHIGTSDFRLRLVYLRPSGDFAWGNVKARAKDQPSGDNFVGRAALQKTRIKSDLSISLFERKVMVTSGMTTRSEGDGDVSLAMTYTPTPNLRWKIGRGRINPWPASSEVYYQYTDEGGSLSREGGRLCLRSPLWMTEVGVDMRLFSRFSFTSVFREGKFIPDNRMHVNDAAPIYEGLFDGIFANHRISGTILLDCGFRLKMAYQGARTDCRLRLFENGERFGYFGGIEFTGRLWEFSLNKYNHALIIRYGSLIGKVGGVLEAWPFLNGLARFIGERRHFIGDGSIDGYSLKLHGPLSTIEGIKTSGSVEALRLAPDIHYVSWRPVFMGFGFDDLQSKQLDIARADLIHLQLCAAIRVFSFRIACDVSQWIPLAIKRREAQSAGAGSTSESPPGLPPEPSLSSNKKWNGLAISMRLESSW